MLTEDATFEMPPYPNWCRGREAIARSWLMPGGPPPRLRYVPARANGHLAVGTYVRDPETERYVPVALDVLTLRGPLIAGVTAFSLAGAVPPLWPTRRAPAGEVDAQHAGIVAVAVAVAVAGSADAGRAAAVSLGPAADLVGGSEP